MPTLAAELVLQILEIAHRPSSSSLHPDTSTLASAALVCTSWAPLAQQVLFRDVDLLRTPERRTQAARAVPGVLLATSGPSHALRDAKSDITPRVSRAARLRALTAAATPPVPTPRSLRSTQSFIESLQIDAPKPSARALSLASLVRSAQLFVAEAEAGATCNCRFGTHFGGVCPNPCSAASPLATGALTERHLAVLLGRLPYLQSVHIVLDRVSSFSSLVTDALRASSIISTLSIHVLKRADSRVPSATPFNANNAVGSSLLMPGEAPFDEDDADAPVFQLIRALAPNLDTLILDGELPRDPPADASSSVARSRRPSIAESISWNADEIVYEPAPDCALRELVWRGKLPPSPALLAWLLSAKAQGRKETRGRSRLEVLELRYLPPPDALAELLREHVPTLRSLRLHYFEAAHVDVVRQLLGQGVPSASQQRPVSVESRLRELVLHRRCAAAPEMLLAVRARHVAVTQPCANTLRALEKAGGRGFQRVTVVDGDKAASEQVRLACEADGITFESVSEW
ncbi:hypothetical protein BDV93DRAFT_257022 [Ceratobasidium sp. AG-I]|nr:hypothetical protein BDV93DRAFT_257022 [Ceratobasidium sp. AG-I]